MTTRVKAKGTPGATKGKLKAAEQATLAGVTHHYAKFNGTEGTYGGFPGSSPEAVARRVSFYGTDTLRVEDGKFVGYWANADSLWLIQQLGVSNGPPLD